MSRAKPGLDSHRIGTLDDSINFPLYESLHHLRKMLVEPFAQHRPQHFQNMILDGTPAGRDFLALPVHFAHAHLRSKGGERTGGCVFGNILD